MIVYHTQYYSALKFQSAAILSLDESIITSCFGLLSAIITLLLAVIYSYCISYPVILQIFGLSITCIGIIITVIQIYFSRSALMAKQEPVIEKKSIEEFRLPRYIEIPNVGLYLKQVVRFINDALSPFFDISVTETMLSNYVKKHIIASPVKKLYNREQIASLMFITLAKNVTSLENLQTMFMLQRSAYEPGVAYDYLCDEFENIIAYVYGFKSIPNIVEEDGNYTKALLRNLIITVGYKLYMDNSFSNMKSK